MKRLAVVFVLGTVTAFAAVAPAAAGQKQRPCSEARILRVSAELKSMGDVYQWERCGQKVGIAFG